MSFDNTYGKMLAQKVQKINERKVRNMGDIDTETVCGAGAYNSTYTRPVRPLTEAVDDSQLERVIGGALLNRSKWSWEQGPVKNLTQMAKKENMACHRMLSKPEKSSVEHTALNEGSGLFSDVLGSFGLGRLGVEGGAMAFGKVKKARGRPKKQTQKDKEDEKLAMEVKGLKETQGLLKDAVEGGAMAFGKMKKTKKQGKGFLSDMMGSFGLGQMKEGGAMAFGKMKKTKKQGKGFLSDIVGSFGLGQMKDSVGYSSDFIPSGISGKVSGGAYKLVPQQAMKGSSMSGGASKTDGRKKRAEIVRKVMAEKGLSMIEASRFVKQNNLY